MRKYLMLALATIFTISLSVMAQDPAPQGPNGGKREFRQGERPMISSEKRAEMLAKQLNLTDAEKAKVQALYQKQDADRQKKKAEVKKTREEMRAQFDAERKANDEELAKIIGTEKFQKLQAARAEHQQRMKERRENGPKPESQDAK